MKEPEQSSTRALQAQILQAESHHSPREFLRLMRSLRGNPAAAALVAENETLKDLSRAWWVQPYTREVLSPDVTLFRGRASPKGRRLLICATALHGRMTVPASGFLQSLPARTWDVLMLRDGRRTHFRRGCIGFADSLVELGQRLNGLRAAYANCTVIGASMGGLPAIRLALMMPGVRGIAVGGRPADDMVRMYHDRDPGLPFDSLCACLSAARRDLHFIFGAKHRQDRRVGLRYAAVTGGVAHALPEVEAHAIITLLWRERRLARFLATVTDDRVQGPAMRKALRSILPR